MKKLFTICLMIALICIIAPVNAATSKGHLKTDGTWSSNAEITKEDNVHYYTITLPGDGKVVVNLQSWTGQIGYKFWDSDLTKTYQSRNLGGGSESEPVTGEMTSMYLPKGTYQIQIFQYTGYTGYSYKNTGAYRLKVLFTNGNTNETEPNDTPASAIQLGAGKEKTCLMWEDDTYDYFVTTVGADQKLRLKVTLYFSYITLGIRDSEYQTVSDTSGKSLSDVRIEYGRESESAVKELEYNVAPGTYYILMKKYTGYTGSSYSNMGVYKLARLQETIPTPTIAPTATPKPTATPAPKPTAVPIKIPTPTPTPAPEENDIMIGDEIEEGGLVYTIISKSEAELSYSTKKFKKLVIPALVKLDGQSFKVTRIGSNAFKGMTTLVTVTIGANVKTIGNFAFAYCSKLKTVTFGKRVKKIGEKAFSKCIVLSKIDLPAKVSSIGKLAFYGCKKASKIYIRSQKPTGITVGSNAFKNVYAKTVVYVKRGYTGKMRKILKGLPAKATIRGSL